MNTTPIFLAILLLFLQPLSASPALNMMQTFVSSDGGSFIGKSVGDEYLNYILAQCLLLKNEFSDLCPVYGSNNI